MALQDVRFDDLIAKLDEFDRFYGLWHELSFVELKPVNSTWDLHVDCERARRTIRELLPADMMVLNCSSAASDCLIELKEVIDRFDWTIDGSGVKKLRGILQRLVQLGPHGRAMSADHLKEPASTPTLPGELANDPTSRVQPLEREYAFVEAEIGSASTGEVDLRKQAGSQPGDGTDLASKADPWQSVRDFIPKLKGTQRRAVELLVEAGGSSPLADIATDKAIGWVKPYKDSVDSLRRELNDKFRPIMFSVRVFNGRLELVNEPALQRRAKAAGRNGTTRKRTPQK